MIAGPPRALRRAIARAGTSRWPPPRRRCGSRACPNGGEDRMRVVPHRRRRARPRSHPVEDQRHRLGGRVVRGLRVAEPGAVARECGEVRVAAGVDLPVRPEQGVAAELVEDDQHDVRLASASAQRRRVPVSEQPDRASPTRRTSAQTRTAGTLGIRAQPAANKLQPSRRARPSPPQRMTTLWLYSKTGLRDRREQVHPRLRGVHVPLVGHGRDALAVEQAPVPGARQLPRRIADHPARRIRLAHGRTRTRARTGCGSARRSGSAAQARAR